MHAPVAARDTVAKRQRPSGLTVFLSAFVAGAVVSFGINHFVDSQLAQNRPQVECEPIFVALRSLPQGAPVTVWDVALKDWPLAMLPTSALRADNSFEGMILRYPLREGQPLLAVQLARAPSEPGTIMSHVESFSTPTPATDRRTAVAEGDSWLPAPTATSTVAPPATRLAVPPVEPPRPVAAEAVGDTPTAPAFPVANVPATPATTVPDEPAPAAVAFGPTTDVDVAAVAEVAPALEPASALPLVAIADTPVEPAHVESVATLEEASAVQSDSTMGTETSLASADPSSGFLTGVDEPLAGFTATDETVAATVPDRQEDEPRPFVVARRTRPPMAPQPRLDIADSIAVLTRERTPAPTSRPLEAAADAPAESVLVAPRDEEAAGPEDVGLVEPTEPAPSEALVDAASPLTTDMQAEGAGSADAPGGATSEPPLTPPQSAATAPVGEDVTVPLPIPRYLVIPERIAVEADSFFGPPTPTAELSSEPAVQPTPGGQAATGARPRQTYEAPPMANPPPPSFGEMFPNIANGIDALSGPFRSRSAGQPRRTR